MKKVRFPSTTTRHPRPISQWHKYKGSELRVALLFGHVIFDGILKMPYYRHAQLLVMAMQLAEARRVEHEDVHVINRLLKGFVIQFPQLYTKRHCTGGA